MENQLLSLTPAPRAPAGVKYQVQTSWLIKHIHIFMNHGHTIFQKIDLILGPMKGVPSVKRRSGWKKLVQCQVSEIPRSWALFLFPKTFITHVV